MNLNTKLTKESIYSLYYNNKEYALPILSIIISFSLFFVFIVPQVFSFPSRKQEMDIETVKLNRIKETEKILLAADENLIDSQLKTASKALPPNKVFEQILNGISTAAALSGVQIASYQFNNQNDLPSEVEASKFSSLLFEVIIFGTTQEAVEFIEELYKTYPTSDATSIITSSGSTSVKTLFYYKSFPSISPENRTQIKSISAKEKAALDEISEWNDTSIGTIIEPEASASESAQSDLSPFRN